MVSDPEIICVEKCRHYSVNVISLFFFILVFYLSFMVCSWSEEGHDMWLKTRKIN